MKLMNLVAQLLVKINANNVTVTTSYSSSIKHTFEFEGEQWAITLEKIADIEVDKD
jgi:hypothetical protein